MALSCPFKPVAQREAQPAPVHVHQYLVDTLTDLPGVYVLDCSCGHRRRVLKSKDGEIGQEFDDALVPGGSSLDNAIFSRQADGSFADRWAFIH